jgi:hypothetical protein
MQLVQFLLKQAGVDKRTGDLYGNRDLLNIARNMARGIKVCYYLTATLRGLVDAYIQANIIPALCWCREWRMYTHNISLFCCKPWKAY